MKKILLILLLLPVMASARVASKRLDTSATNLTAHFADASGAITAINNANFQSIDTLMIDNRSSSEIVVNCSSTLGVVPSDTSIANIYVNANESWSLPDSTGFTRYCYWRSFSGTISSGIVVITAIGR